MAFLLSDDHRAIRDTAAAFLADAAGAEARTRALESPQGWDPDLWRALAVEMGFAGLMVPEACGGSGLGVLEMALVLEETGRALAVVPLFETAVACVQAILAVGPGDAGRALLTDIASGLRICTPVWPREGHPQPVLSSVEACGDLRLDGEVSLCPFAQAADVLLVACRDAAGETLVAVPADYPGVDVEPRVSLDPTRPLSTVTFREVRADAAWIIGARGSARAGLDRAEIRSAGLLAAELTGVAAYSLTSTVDYVQQRVQFGRPIGSFQAVKHDLADMMVQVEAARSAWLYAAAALDADGPDAAVAASSAKAWCGDAARHCAAEAIQLHGGIGFTWEHPAHLYFKRARSASVWLGDPAAHREIVAGLIGLDAPAPEPV